MFVSHRHAERCGARMGRRSCSCWRRSRVGPGRGAGLAVASVREAPAPAAEVSPTPSFFDVNKYRADPGNPGAIKIPGTNVALYIGGFAQLDVITDANVIGNPDEFVLSSIPVGGGTGNTGFALSARQSRVFIETDAPWTVAPLLAYVELDFFDPQNQSDFHLRHAFGAIGRPDHCASSPARPSRRSWTRRCSRTSSTTRARRSRQRASRRRRASSSLSPGTRARPARASASNGCSRSRRPAPRSRFRWGRRRRATRAGPIS